MKLRSKYISNLTNKNDLKAYAVVILLCHLGHSTVKYNIRNISDILSCSYNTARKRIDYCISNGYLINEDGVLRCVSLRSKHKDRNLSLERFVIGDSLKSVETGLKILLCTNTIRKKEFVKILIDKRKKVKNLKELKHIDKTFKFFGIEEKKKYTEYGLTYDKISTDAKVCKRTAQKYIGKAIDNGVITKRNNRDHIRIKCGGCDNGKYLGDTYGYYTFSYTSPGYLHLYIQKANTYSLA